MLSFSHGCLLLLLTIIFTWPPIRISPIKVFLSFQWFHKHRYQIKKLCSKITRSYKGCLTMPMARGSTLLFTLLIAWIINLSPATLIKLETPHLTYYRELLSSHKWERKLKEAVDLNLKNEEDSTSRVGTSTDFDKMLQNILERLNTSPGKSVSFNRRQKRESKFDL